MNARPFFVVITFVLLIALFAGGAMSSKDLTPDTPPVYSSPGLYDTANFPVTGGDPLYSPCGSTYTVRSGDTLSRIALACNVSLNSLISSNPSIVDPNLIRPGQVLYIYYAPVAVPPTAIPKAVLPVAIPNPQDVSIPNSGLKPGGSVHVTINQLPANTPVSIFIGKFNEEPIKLEERNTDANGQIVLSVAIPPYAKPGEQWMVAVRTLNVPPITVASAPFIIE